MIPLVLLVDTHLGDVVAPILPGVESDFLTGECIDPGMASGEAACDVAGPLTLTLGKELCVLGHP